HPLVAKGCLGICIAVGIQATFQCSQIGYWIGEEVRIFVHLQQDVFSIAQQLRCVFACKNWFCHVVSFLALNNKIYYSCTCTPQRWGMQAGKRFVFSPIFGGSPKSFGEKTNLFCVDNCLFPDKKPHYRRCRGSFFANEISATQKPGSLLFLQNSLLFCKNSWLFSAKSLLV